MKPLFNNWREYLKESLLKEFKKSDAEAVLEDEDSFTVSYEIELVSSDYVGLESEEDGDYGMPDEYSEQYAEQRRRYAAGYLDDYYFEEQTREGESEMLWYHVFDDGDDPDLQQLMEFYIEEKTPYGGPQAEFVTEIASLDFVFDDVKREFSEILKKLTTPGTKENKIFLQFLKSNPEIKRDLEDRGATDLTDKQQTLPGVEMESDVAKEAFRRYIYDYEKRGFPYGVGFGPTISLFNLLYAIDEEEFVGDLTYDADLKVEQLINPSRWTTVGELTSIDKGKSPLYNNLAKLIEEKAEEFIEETSTERQREYESDPEEYLNDMGYDWEGVFEDWWQNNWEYYVESGSEEGGEENARRLLEEYLPNFYSEYSDIIKIVSDGSLPSNYNMEIVIDDPPMWIDGLDAGLEYMETFFNDFNNQDNFRFSPATGLHTNIGYMRTDESGDKNQVFDYNLIKSLLFLNEDFALKNFEKRKGSRWVGDLKVDALKSVKDLINSQVNQKGPEVIQQWLLKNFDEVEKIVNKTISHYADAMYSKGIGFNINYASRRGYIEFRYPGNEDITYEGIKDATLYYAHVVKAGADDDYKKGEYLKKLTSFIENAKASSQTSITDFSEIREMVEKFKDMPLYKSRDPELATSEVGPFIRSLDEIGVDNLGWEEDRKRWTDSQVWRGAISGRDFFWINSIKKGDSVDNTMIVLDTLENTPGGPKKIQVKYPIKDFERNLRNGVLIKVMNRNREEILKDIYDKTGETVNEVKNPSFDIEQIILKTINRKMFNF